MQILVRNIGTGLENIESTAFAKAMEAANLRPRQVKEIYLAKTSVDARHKKSIRLVHTVGIELADGEAFSPAAASPNIVTGTAGALEFETGSQKLEHRPVVVGFGPAGMFAALYLARCGLRPLVLERGSRVEDRTSQVDMFWKKRILGKESNVQFGEGGAGTFSDGKLTTRINDPLCSFVLEQMTRFGAPQEIMRKSKPHVGTDYLRAVVRNIRQEIISLGGEVRFNTKLEDIDIKGGALRGIRANGQDIPATALILAVGHSARDTFELLLERGLDMEQKPFSVGLRIEHLQQEVDRALYGSAAGHPALPKGEYQLSHRAGDRAVYTFCMCPGGLVVPSASEEGHLVTNGMSYYSRDGENANSALVVSVDHRDYGSHVLGGIEFQRRLEQQAYIAGGSNWAAPVQTVGRFLGGKAGADFGSVRPSFACGANPADLGAILPPQVTEMLKTGLNIFGRKQSSFAAADAVLTGTETRTSSPIRILRGEDLQSLSVKGIYPSGEGAGYAGGIMSAAVDGLRTAIKLASKFSPN